MAQQAQESALAEITVTAQKVKQSIDDVPISVSALGGSALQHFGFQSAAAIASQIPNVAIQDTGLTLLFAIRGQHQGDFGDANESPVGLYIDDVYRSTSFGQNGQLFDVDRVEVLRGPQGTLYGRNTTAGLIHFISKRPTKELEGYADVRVGSYGQRILEGAIGGPLTDRIRARLSSKFNEDDGFQENLAAGGRFAKTHSWAVRGQVEVDVFDGFTALSSVTYTSQQDIPAMYGFYGVLTFPTSFEQCSVPDINAAHC